MSTPSSIIPFPQSPASGVSERIQKLRAHVLEHDCEPGCPGGYGSANYETSAAIASFYFERCEITILPGELLIGGRGSIEAPEIERMRKAAGEHPTMLVPEKYRNAEARGFVRLCGNHQCPDFNDIITHGLSDVLERIERSLEVHRKSQDAEGVAYLESMRVLALGALTYCRRCAEAARKEMAACEDPARRTELATIAENCEHVILKPATNFWQACQAAWFTFLLSPDSPGRMDQYLYSFYKNDLERGTLTREFAKELLSCLWIKIYGYLGRKHERSGVNHMSLGGTTRDGGNAVNELSFLCLEVAESVRLMRPQIALRWNSGTPREFLRKGVELLRANIGSPDFSNDDQIIPALERIGVKTEDARDFTPSGCNEIMIPGKSQMGALMGEFNLPKTLLCATGVEALASGGTLSIAIHGWDELWAAWKMVLADLVECIHGYSFLADQHRAKLPMWMSESLLTEGCIEKARGLSQGGATYNYSNWDAIGIGNLADAFYTIKTLVFEEKALSLTEFLEVLKDDWSQAKALRTRVVNSHKLFGNANPEVDQIAAGIIQEISAQFALYKPFRGGCYTLGTLAGYENAHVEFGSKTMATFDGRFAGESFAASLGPVPGHDRSGITAMLSSVSSLPNHLLPTSTTVNITIDPKLLSTDAGVHCFASLIEAHFKSGGLELQITIADAQLLKEAQREPEKYSSLMVRVAGYSANFNSLEKPVQDEIINRTVNSL